MVGIRVSGGRNGEAELGVFRKNWLWSPSYLALGLKGKDVERLSDERDDPGHNHEAVLRRRAKGLQVGHLDGDRRRRAKRTGSSARPPARPSPKAASGAGEGRQGSPGASGVGVPAGPRPRTPPHPRRAHPESPPPCSAAGPPLPQPPPLWTPLPRPPQPASRPRAPPQPRPQPRPLRPPRPGPQGAPPPPSSGRVPFADP